MTTELSGTDFESIKGAQEDPRSAQWWLLFACIVAGKNAEFAENALKKLLGTSAMMPFDNIEGALKDQCLRGALRIAKTGNYGKLYTCFEQIIAMSKTLGRDPRDWMFADLMRIHGIGPKTARWFRMLVRPNEYGSALDTHVLKFLADVGVPNVPKSTPTWGGNYRRLEVAFMERCEKLQMSPRDLDFFVWAVYRNGGKITGV